MASGAVFQIGKLCPPMKRGKSEFFAAQSVGNRYYLPGSTMKMKTVCAFVVLLCCLATKTFSQQAPISEGVKSTAIRILDDSTPKDEREKLATESTDSAGLIRAMTTDLPADHKEEYRRIPWIWRAALAAGKRNNATELKELMLVAMPQTDSLLRDWQAVVIGGGIINGLSQKSVWPEARILQALGTDKNVLARWQHTLELATTMIDDEKVPKGTRYDAMRIVGAAPSEQNIQRLLKYLAKGVDAELQQGAISGLSDINSDHVAGVLLADIDHFSGNNLKLALDALTRTDNRIGILLDGIAIGRINASALSETQLQKINGVSNKKLRARAEKLLTKQNPQPTTATTSLGGSQIIGLAKIDITPAFPIRLSGYAGRKAESEGVAQHLFAKAIAIGADKDKPAVLLTVDNVGIPAALRNEVARRLAAKAHITTDRFALCSSHSHTAPFLKGTLPTLFGEDIPAEHQKHIDAYYNELLDKLEQVSLAALHDRKPARVSWGETKANFAANRRTKGGPVDQDLPVLHITDSAGHTRGLLVNYACHCTTLGGEFNQVCGDWAGYAQEYLESNHPGTIALVAIGCGADANPEPRTGLELAKQHGREIASAVDELLARNLTPITGKLQCNAKDIKLPLDKLPSTQEWEERAKKPDYAGYQARRILQRLDKGEELPTEIPYFVQEWNFGDDLAMIFLPGEVVVDYSLRLKKELDAKRLWINAYANDVPCYIPSKRILHEGGYEGGGAMVYYDKPARLAEPTEDLIIGAVHDLVPKGFVIDQKELESPSAKSLSDVFSTFHKKSGFIVKLAAHEPQIVDPVAIDFATDGRLFVAEMYDYPTGLDGNFKPGGRVKVLEDSNSDGTIEKTTLFLDELPFPTGLMQWRNGILICAAPDIIYAEDTNGDGKADVVKKLFTGFATHNYQARINCLRWGLDNWVYAAGGLFGGKIKSHLTGKEIDCNGRDIRFNPDTGAIEPVNGTSQQGRVRDDWGNWFGCNNSVLALQFPLPDRYVRRNPFVATPEPFIYPIKDADPNALFPVSRTLERFNNPNSANRTTSACGIEIYRDVLLGDEYYGNAFTGETVHNLVRRIVLEPDGATFTGHRAAGEEKEEFFASTDNWFRPVEIRTGPDGALWISDMYRFVIEHPRWISAERLAKLDVRAGSDKGRIYRLYPANKELRPIHNLAKMKSKDLITLFDTPNGTVRDLIHREIYQRQDKAVVKQLKRLADQSEIAAVRAHALCVLDGLNALWPEDVYNRLTDADPRVREVAVRLSEDFISSGRTTNRDHVSELDWNPALPLLKEKLGEMINDPDERVRYQLALSLGEWRNDPKAATILSELAKKECSNPWIRAAILTSSTRWPAEILVGVLTLDEKAPGRQEMIAQLVATAAGAEDPHILQAALAAIAPAKDEKAADWQLTALASLVETLDRKKLSLSTIANFSTPETRQAIERLEKVAKSAGEIASNPEATIDQRDAALRMLSASADEKDLKILVQFATKEANARLQKTAQKALRSQRSLDLPKLLINEWKTSLVKARPAIIELLLGRDEGVEKLLDAVEDKSIATSEIAAANRQTLLKHSNEKLRKRAESLFPVNENRQAVLAKFSQEVPKLTGNIENGGHIFAQSCAPCHAFRGHGFAVGPDLAPLGDKPVEDFLLAILDPSSVVEPRFVQYTIDTKDDRSLSGVVTAETSTSVTLSQAGGVTEKILRSEITSMRASPLSLMPEGLEQGRTAQDLADLIAYVKSRPATFGEQSPESAAEARKKFVAAGANGFAKLISASEKLDYPSWLGALPLAHCRQTDGKSKVTWETDPLPREVNGNQFYNFRLPVAMGFHSNPAGKFSLAVNGKAVLQFDVSLGDHVWTSEDGRVTMRYQVMQNNAEDSNGVLNLSLKGDILPTGSPVTFEVTGGAANSQRWFGVYVLSPELRASR